MRSSAVFAFAIACTGLTLAACQSDPSTAPRSRPGANASLGGAPLVCDFSAIRQDASDFFTSPSDPIFDIIDDVELLWAPGGTPAADNKAFDGMARLAAARGTADQQGDGQDGAGVIEGLMGCTTITAVPADVDSLEVAIDEGLLEVRAGSSDPVKSALAFRASAGSRVPADPMWGAETPNWSATLGQRTLLFGYERPVSTFTAEPPVLDGQGAPFTGFELSSFPAGLTFPASAQLTAGICIDPFVFGLSRLLHNALPSSAILTARNLSFCTGGGAGHNAAGPSGTALGGDAGITRVGGVGGSLSGLSPSGAVRLSPRNDALVFTQQPSDGIANRPITPPVQVTAETQLGTPIGGVAVTLTLHPSGQTFTATTKNDGTATFANIRIPVAGSFTLTATGTIAESSVKPAASRQFKIRA